MARPMICAAFVDYQRPGGPLANCEFPLYSDTTFQGEIRSARSPLVIIPLLPDAPSYRVASLVDRPGAAMRPAAVVRVQSKDGDVRPVETAPPAKTDTDSYHGGGIDDEVAAIASLVFGIRCRPGGVTRRWWADEGADSAGSPVIGERQTPVWFSPAGQAMVPTIPAVVDLNELHLWLDRISSLDGCSAVAFVRAARLYGNAIWIADSDPNLAWLQLVAAIEVAAVLRKGSKPAWKRVEEIRPDLWEILVRQGDDHARQVGSLLAQLLGSADRFNHFMKEFLPARAAG